MTVFDVGAHAGKYTKLFSLLVGEAGRVIAFEPTPGSAKRIASEVVEAGLKNVTLLQNAVAERSGVVALHQFPEEYSSWNGLGRPHMEDPRNHGQFVPIVGSLEVDAITLDEFCRDQRIERIDYLKLDVEGAELRALQGARGLLERKAIGHLQFEISQKMLEGLSTTARPVFDYLASKGYECHAITDAGEVGQKVADSSAFYENYIAVPRGPAGQQARRPAGLPGEFVSSAGLPLHFFTIVLNGRPFIEHHIRAFEKLPFRWHWHVIEGVAELNHDTAWSKSNGGRIAPELHRHGLSHDGTTEYLDELARRFPSNVTLYRQPAGMFWDGKLEMVNAPLAQLREECLLWQVDSDELWTAEQLIAARNLFLAQPEKTAAFYFCHYFVGEKLVITTRHTYGNNPGYEWIRTWRFTPGCRWLAHEPPRLCRPVANGKWADLASINPLRHAETEAAGLVFQHFAYATVEQLKFKEAYYGYARALAQWKKLQQQRSFPVALSKHFDWVKDAAQVNTAESQGITPLAVKEPSGSWTFPATPSAAGAQRILFVRTDAIGDAVLAAPMLPLIRAKYPTSKIAVLCREHVAELYVCCPSVDTVICFDWQKVRDDEAARGEILREINQFKPDLILNSTYSSESVTEVLIHAQQAPVVIGIDGDLSNISAQDRADCSRLYTRLIPSHGELKPERERHRDFLAGLGIVADDLEPRVWTSPEDDALAETFFQEQKLDAARTIALFPGAQHACKIYPHLAEAVRELAGLHFLIFGGAEVTDSADQLAKQLPGPSINLCGKTTLREMAALFRKCRLYVGADSAGAHIACAVGLPNVVVLGGGHFGRFFPYSPLTSAACLPLECYECNWACRFPTVHCVKDLDPAVVSEAIRQTLAHSSDRARVFIQDRSLWPESKSPRWQSAEHWLAGTNAEIISVTRRTDADRPAEPTAQAKIAAAVTKAVSGPEPRRRVLNIISRLEPDHWLERNLKMYADATTPWFDAATFLNWFAHTFQPENYLEVGVRRGRSMAQVLVESRKTRAFGFDLWIPDYGSVPSQGIHTANPGPEFVRAELDKLGVLHLPTLISGYSHQTLPQLFARRANPQQFDLIFIDGDHTREGAQLDLDLAFAHLAPGGALVFDDIDNPSHLDLRELWGEYQVKFPDWLFIEDRHGAGTGVAFRPPLDRLLAFVQGAAPSFLENVAALRSQADQKLQEGRLVEAGRAYAQLWSQNPKDVGLLLALATCFLRAGDTASARMTFEEVLKVEPNHDEAKARLLQLDKADEGFARTEQPQASITPRATELAPSPGVADRVPAKTNPRSRRDEGGSIQPTRSVRHHDNPRQESSAHPLVSVIVSAYAAEKYIRACLEDLVAQTIFDKLEIIVIDSGSPQNERAIVEEFQKRHPNIHYHRTERETLYAAWNRAIGLARGKYIANANCDDSHRADALEKLSAALEAHPEADLAYGDYYTSWVPNDSFARPHILRPIAHPPYHPATVMMYCVTGCHPMWRRTVFDQIGLFDPTFTAPGDYEFLLRFVQAGLRAVHVPQPLSLFFQNAEGLSWKFAAQSKKENDRILGQYRSQMPMERLFHVDPSDPAAVSRAWVALGNLAMQYEVPWLSNYLQDLPYARFCYEQALKMDSRNVAAGQNLVAARVLQQQSAGDRGFLELFPADIARSLQRDIQRGKLTLVSVQMPPAVEPIEFGERQVDRITSSDPIAPKFAESAGQLPLPVRLAANFLNDTEAAADALSLTLALASRTELATFDHGAPYSAQFEAKLPDKVRFALRDTRSRFEFCLGGIVVSVGRADELQHVRGAACHIGRTLFEADHLPIEWVKICNQMDELWVPNRFHVELFAASGVEHDKLAIIPFAVDAREFDPERHAPWPLPNRAAFNFLAVFDWRMSQGWDVLLASYLREFSADDNVCLFLRTGIGNKSEAESRAAIEQQIREFVRTLKLAAKKLPPIELLIGERAAVDLPKLYRAADCVVAPNRAEALGRVAREAMMMGLPVIATNWGGHTDFINEQTAYPLDCELVPAGHLELDEWQYHGQRWANPSERHLRELMRRVQQSPAEARAKGVTARAWAQQHFSAEVVADLCLARLKAIAERLISPQCPAAKTGRFPNRPSAIGHRQSLNVALEGSFLDFGSLSHVNRELSRQLAKQPGISLTCAAKNIVPPELAHHRSLVETARRLKYPAPKNAQITIRHAWPPNWERPASGKWVLIQPWEFGVLPEEWLKRLGDVDEIWTPSQYARRVYVESGVDPRKVCVVPNGVDPELFRPDATPATLATQKKFKFLFVGGTIQRKGPDLLLKAYLENFAAADDVCLVIKDFGGQNVYAGQTFESQIRAAQSQPDAPEVLYLNDDLAPEALPGLYTACDCLVHPYRGEGFGLPVLEAMACGLPVIVTGGGSTDDFAGDEFAYRIPALRKQFGPSVSGLKLLRDGWLLEPDLAALGERMKQVVSHRDEAQAKGRAASEQVRREWTWERAAQIAACRLQELAGRDESKPIPKRSSDPIALPLTAKVGHLGEARALFNEGKLEPAWRATAAALAARPFHPEAFLLLAEIALAAGDPHRAKELAERARQMAPRWKPAQLFLKGGAPGSRPARTTTNRRDRAEPELGAPKLPPLPESACLAPRASRLTVCLITRNEEQFLAQCLQSIRELAGQVVVVDTGSTDLTRDIAARHGAEVYSFDWCEDFSAARNAALERATGDWVLFLDADEELLPGQREKLLQLLEDRQAIAFRLPMIDQGHEEEGISYVPRLFRNAPGLFHVGRVHEQVFSSVEVRRQEWGLENKFGDATLLHHGYTKEMVKSRDKLARNLRLLQKALEELPGEPNLLMNLGLELVRAGRLRDGLEQYDAAFRALSALPPEEVVPELRETLLTQYCTHLLTAKNYAQIARVLGSPVVRRDGLSATLHWLVGLACLESKNFADGAEHMRRCLAKRDQPALSPINKNILKAGPHHCLALCLAALKQLDAANKAFGAALEADPKSRPVQFDYARFLAENGQEVEALKVLHQLVTADPSDPMLWQFGGKIALSQPPFLEVACDWTAEASKIFPAHHGIAEQRAQALLLSGQLEEALPRWKQFGSGANASHRAALLICEALLDQPLQPVPKELAGRVNQEFVSWYRRLLAMRAEKIVLALNQRVESLRPVVPAAMGMLEAALAEAGTAPSG
jgi:FkbM family methyltransferase